MLENILTKTISFKAGSETLVGRETWVAHAPIRCLFLHGAGQSSKERTIYLADALAQHDVGSFGFDFSGHGESSGHLSQSSLAKRLTEARVASHYLDANQPLILVASSMGGHLAIRLLPELAVTTLVLFCPAIYSQEAEPVPFGNGFSEIIRQPDNWRHNQLKPMLNHYRGRLVLICGEDDQVIPPGVIDFIEGEATQAKINKIVLPGVGHAVHAVINTQPQLVTQIAEAILNSDNQ